MKKMSNRVIMVVLLAAFLLTVMVSDDVFAEKKGYLGVTIGTLSRDVKRELGLYHGVVIKKVTENSPAEAAGFLEDDILLTFNGEKVRRPSDLVYAVRDMDPNTKVKATILRDKAEKELNVVVGKSKERPRTFTIHSGGHAIRLIGEGHGYLGVVMQDLNADLASYFGVKEGEGTLLVDVKEESPAGGAGIKAGDVILKIENEEIHSSADVYEIMAQTEAGDKIKIDVMRHSKRQTFEVELAERSMERDTIFLNKFKDLDGLRRMKMHIFSPDEQWDTEDFLLEGGIDHHFDDYECGEDLHFNKSCNLIHECSSI